MNVAVGGGSIMPGYKKLEEPEGDGEEDFAGRSKGALAIQRLFNRHRLVFGKLGTTIFSRHGGQEADYGELTFSASKRTVPFMTVADTTSTTLFGNFMEKNWKLARPEVIISVTGGAQDFELTPRLQRVFDRGLVSAAAATNAWVFTGGTDTGVMKLVASAFERGNVQTPIIGVTSYGCVKGRDAFDGTRSGDPKVYACDEKATFTGAPLNPHHTHFVFVDNGKVAPAAWGGEIGLRGNLENTYSRSKGVPMVLLVVQGGPGTLQTVATVAELGQAILIVQDSGGAADAIADYVLRGKTDDPKFQAEKLQATLAHIKELQEASEERVITFFSLNANVEMSTMLLRALVKVLLAPDTELKSKGHSRADEAQEADKDEEKKARALILAVNWDRVDIAKDLLRDMSAKSVFTCAPRHTARSSCPLRRRRGIPAMPPVTSWHASSLPLDATWHTLLTSRDLVACLLTSLGCHVAYPLDRP